MTEPAQTPFDPLRARLRTIRPAQDLGTVARLARDHLDVTGLQRSAALGDRVLVGGTVHGEILRIDEEACRVVTEGSAEGLRLGMPVANLGRPCIAPSSGWLGRIVDPEGQPMDGRPLFPGHRPRPLAGPPPPPARRRGLGVRLATGFAAFDTLLPIVRGQRIGLFAGSGVGKSQLLGALARNVEADVAVIGLIGERGREVRDFATETLPEEALRRSVIVAATSDRPALSRARAAAAVMAVAEHFRDEGRHVLLLVDSVTRFAEAQGELAAAAGEPFGPGGVPASMAQMAMSLAERAGPGADGQGDITAVFSVLVAGSDMDGPVADIMRGVLDGHVVLSREIAERGRYPAIDVLASVSRALPAAATADEMSLITRARQLLGAHARAELMLQSGLYTPGSDAITDAAVEVWDELDAFLARPSAGGFEASFAQLEEILSRGHAAPGAAGAGSQGAKPPEGVHPVRG
jgi:flagellum-specific ATP synthase